MNPDDFFWHKNVDIEGSYISPKNRIGYCSNLTHRGNLNLKQYRNHKCEEKQCPYFIRNMLNPYWERYDKRKQWLKSKRKSKKEAKLRKKNLLSIAREVYPTNQKFAFVRVDFENNCYFIYYVSLKKTLISEEITRQIKYKAKIFEPICYKAIHTSKEDKIKIIEKVMKETDDR